MRCVSILMAVAPFFIHSMSGADGCAGFVPKADITHITLCKSMRNRHWGIILTLVK
jgi:hypothetical protein